MVPIADQLVPETVGLFGDLEHADLFLETFLVISWAEHLRQHAPDRRR